MTISKLVWGRSKLFGLYGIVRIFSPGSGPVPKFSTSNVMTLWVCILTSRTNTFNITQAIQEEFFGERVGLSIPLWGEERGFASWVLSSDAQLTLLQNRALESFNVEKDLQPPRIFFS